MKIIAITSEKYFANEAEYINTLLDNGVDYVHIRKPNEDKSYFINLIEAIPDRLYPRLKLHSFYELQAEYKLGGIHYKSSSTPSYTMPLNCKISRSCHSIDEIKNFENGYEYNFLSPIFDSISKKGYTSKFQLSEIERAHLSNVIALGGIKPEHLPILKQTGFIGAAFLGYLSEYKTQNELMDKLYEINKYKNICYNL